MSDEAPRTIKVLLRLYESSPAVRAYLNVERAEADFALVKAATEGRDGPTYELHDVPLVE